MKIGEFAQAAGLPISVLRHYDKEGLLNPDYIDAFTGYRHYSGSQLERVRRITLLKQAGLALKEIKDILENSDNRQFILKILDDHRAKYRDMLTAIEEVKHIMLNKKEDTQIPFQNTYQNREKDDQIIIEREGEDILFKSMPLMPSEDRSWLVNAQALLDTEICKRDYQRISGFLTYGKPDSPAIQVAARVVPLRVIPLGAVAAVPMEDIDLPFENDEAVIGKWRVIGEYAVEEDFFADIKPKESGDGNADREIYFLPDGKDYWIYGWTKGYLKLHTGDGKWLSRYHLRDYQGRVYMFLENKSYEYRRGGMPTTLVLEQLDHKAYTNAEIISRKDNVDIPYVRDERVLGDWKAVDFIRSKEDFSPSESHLSPDSLFFKHMHFGEDGEITSLYGSEIISGKTKQSWTKGYVLRYWNHTACAYEIVTVENVDYMIIEWKSGDYRWGGRDTDYYVFVKES